MPLLSIITINYNNYEGLQKTFDSVFRQIFTDFEYIVIDGGSTDKSKEIIESYSNKLAYWVSEKDKGIYNAMNKGIVKAKGEYLMFLNSGDRLFNENVVKKIFEQGNGADIIYGNMQVEHGNKITEWILTDKPAFGFFLNSSLPHACSFIKKSLFDKTGLYNENYKIVSDWEVFLLAVHKYQCSYKYIPMTTTIFNTNGISNKKESQQLIKEERNAVLQQHFASFLPEYERYNKLQEELYAIKQMFFFRVYNKLNKLFHK